MNVFLRYHKGGYQHEEWVVRQCDHGQGDYPHRQQGAKYHTQSERKVDSEAERLIDRSLVAPVKQYPEDEMIVLLIEFVTFVERIGQKYEGDVGDSMDNPAEDNFPEQRQSKELLCPQDSSTL